MTFKEFCIAGLKVLGSIAIGIGAFFGINKIIENCSENKNTNSQPVNNKDETGEMNDNLSNENNNLPTDINNENKLVGKVRDAQNVIGKLFTTAQSLSVVIESFIRLFDKNSYSNYFNPQFQPGFNGGFSGGYGNSFGNQVYPQRIDMGNGMYAIRRSPFIVEVPPMNPNGYYHKDEYPF